MTVAAVDYGTDVAHLYDLGLRWGLVSGQANLAMAIVRRLSTTRGTLYYDLSYGFNLLDALNRSFTTAELGALRSQVVAEVLKDPRVDDCAASVVVGQDTLTVTLVITSGDGPFELVLGVSALSVDVLNAGQVGAPAGLSAAVTPSFSGPPGPAGPPGVGVQGAPGPAGPAGTASQSFSATTEEADDSGVERVMWQFAFDAGNIASGTLAADFNMLASSGVGVATFRLYVGGSFVNVLDPPGGGTLIDTKTRNGASFIPIKLSGAPFANPTGVVPVQVTIQSSAVAADARMKNMSGSITG